MGSSLCIYIYGEALPNAYKVLVMVFKLPSGYPQVCFAHHIANCTLSPLTGALWVNLAVDAQHMHNQYIHVKSLYILDHLHSDNMWRFFTYSETSCFCAANSYLRGDILRWCGANPLVYCEGHVIGMLYYVDGCDDAFQWV